MGYLIGCLRTARAEQNRCWQEVYREMRILSKNDRSCIIIGNSRRGFLNIPELLLTCSKFCAFLACRRRQGVVFVET